MRSFYAPLRAAILSAALIGLTTFGTTAAHAQTVIYTSSAAFLAATQAGFYTETFTGTGTTTGGSTGATSTTGFNFTGGGFSYNINANGASGAYRSGTFVGAFNSPATVTINFTSGNVTAFGANFFNTDAGDAFLASSPVTLLLSNGTTTTFTPASTSEYRGFTSNVAITSLTFTATNPPSAALAFASLDNLTVGTRVVAAAAPEPGTFVLVGVGAVPLMGVVARRRRKTA